MVRILLATIFPEYRLSCESALQVHFPEFTMPGPLKTSMKRATLILFGTLWLCAPLGAEDPNTSPAEPGSENPDNPQNWVLPEYRQIPRRTSTTDYVVMSREGIWHQSRPARSRSPKTMQAEIEAESEEGK